MWLILDIYYLLQNALSQKILFAGIHHYNPRCTPAAALRGRGRLLLVSGLGHVDARCRHRLQHRQGWASQLLGQWAGVVMGTRFPSISICNDIFQAGRYNNIIWYRSEWNFDKTRYWINLSTWIYLRLRVYWPLTWQGFSRGWQVYHQLQFTCIITSTKLWRHFILFFSYPKLKPRGIHAFLAI